MKNLFLSLAVIATLTVVSCKEKAAEVVEGTETAIDTANAEVTETAEAVVVSGTEAVEAVVSSVTEEVKK